MFIGHYGPALGAKAARNTIPLWVLFLAVQWMDVVWSILVMLGIEKLRVVPGLMAASPLDLYYMPYTHGLAGALVLSAIFGGVASLFFREQRRSIFLIVGACVFSHWLLDLLVHRPDLWLFDDIKVGFGLWRWLWISLPLELGSLFAGAWLYARCVSSRPAGRIAFWLFVGLLGAAQIYASFAPVTPATPLSEAHTALFAYLAFAALAAVVDRLNSPAAQRTIAVA